MSRFSLSLLLFLFFSLNGLAQEAKSINRNVPQFPGGEQALAKFIYTNMHYPDKAQILGITGLVKVQFDVLANGKILNARLLNDIGGGCGTEAMRLVSLMPNWKPGIINGKPASISVTLPIMFDLRERKIKRKKLSRKERKRLRKLKKVESQD